MASAVAGPRSNPKPERTIMSDIAHKLQDMEIRLTFLDDAVSSLSGADAELSLRLQAVERTLRALREEIQSLRTAGGHDPHSEPPPPHY
jgi:SlyX protein